jgi:hypothetical protein
MSSYHSSFSSEINNIYWQKPKMKKQRNELVMEALEDENLHKLVEANNCIHVKKKKILTKKSVFGNYLTI